MHERRAADDGAGERAAVLPTPAERPPRLYGIQYLRGVAALCVVAYHASGGILPTGTFGVNLFFVISGFLMFAITDASSRPGPFLVDRALRVVPLYWLATLAQIAWMRLRGEGGLEHGEWVFASFLFLPVEHSPVPMVFNPVLPQGWTLNYEMMFYLTTGLLLFLPRRAQLPTLAALFAALVAAGPFVPPGSPPLLFWTRPIILLFLAGALIWLLWRSPNREAAIGWSAIGVGLGVYAVMVHPLFSSLILAVLAAAPLLAGTLILERAGLVRRWRLAALLGDASYSIYLWHFFPVWLAFSLAEFLGVPRFYSYPFAFVGGVLFGLAAYKLIEEPFLALVRRRKYRRGVPIPAGV